MQPLHWGFFVRWDGEKPDGAPKSIRRDVRRETRRYPWNFSPYLDIVYHKAL